ncbi:hypothetical protein HPP92_005817 [Vanilla planifolia]|uniref:Protein TIME FOR COFFEE n=1 Tax=Vanilla planifolia TaxID=51239 RepID=A0A835RZJ3_VANPL|nr:hypothetical protein HPP92_005817 [Vanilla planifolia]
MDRIREARRGTIASANGGLSRRRQRSSSLRDSPEEDGATEMQEMSRLRDRGIKKDRDFDRSTRNKRRRSDTMMHGGHREDGDDTSEESVPEEDDYEEEESSAAVRLPFLPAPSPPISASAIQNNLRKGYLAKVVRPSSTGACKVAEEMIGAPIPRKARSSSVKRSQEYWISSGGGGGGGCGACEPVYRQASTSPVRPSPSTASVSPSSSNASKLIGVTNHRPPKTSKSSSIQEIEIEVAEVLFEMTRQNHKHDSKENNKSGNEVSPRFPSPIRISSSPASCQSPVVPPSAQAPNSSPLTTNAPKRKRPRMRFDEETTTSSPSTAAIMTTTGSSAGKLDTEATPPPVGPKVDALSPRSEKNSPSPAVENVAVPICTDSAKVQQESIKQESKLAPEPEDTDDVRAEKKVKESPSNKRILANLDVNLEEPSANETVSSSPREEKFSIDLMVPPSTGKSSSEMESTSVCVAEREPGEMEISPIVEVTKVERENMEKNSTAEPEEIILDEVNGGTPLTAMERYLDAQLDQEKPEKDVTGAHKHHAQQQQPSKTQRTEPKTEKANKTPATSFPLPMQISGWPTGLPPFGYVGQVSPLPPVIPVDGVSNSTKTLQSTHPSQIRPKRCATHFYIAQNILYHKQITRISPFWPSAAGAAPLYASKQFNLNSVPPSDSAILGGPLQGSVPGRNLSSIQEKSSPIPAGHLNLPVKDKINGVIPLGDGSQRKQPILQQSSQAGSAGNMLAPAFIFPLNQQQSAVANKPGAAKVIAGSGNTTQSSTATSSPAVGTSVAPGTTMSFNYPGLPPSEAQYLAFLQSNGYPFSIPANVGGAQPYRGVTTPGQAVPILNFSFYPSQMLHPSQLRLQPQPSTTLQQAPQNQNLSTSSGSSSSQKNSQQSQRAPHTSLGAVSAGHSHTPPTKQHHLLPHQPRQLESDSGGGDTPSTADSRVPQAQKTFYGSKFAIPGNSQNFTLISSANLSSSGGNICEKNQQQQAFAMSFSSFGGAAPAAGGNAPQGLDFSSMAHSRALFQSLPDASRHGYQISTAHAAQQQQHKKHEDGKTAADFANAGTIAEDGKIPSAGKVVGNAHAQQHSLTFSRADADSSISSVLGHNSNLIQPQTGGALRVSNQTGTATTAANSVTCTSPLPNPQLQKNQLQPQQQQRAKPAASNSVYIDRLPGNFNATKFPQPLTGFPPTLAQSTTSAQSSHWKAAARAATASPSPASSSAKSQIPTQQQSRNQQQPTHQTQISFGVSPAKIAVSAGGNNAPSLSSAATGSTQNPPSKNSGGSPRSSSVAKAGPSLSSAMPFQKQQLGKNSLSSTSAITPLLPNNRNLPSILGNAQINSISNASSKPQQSSHQSPKQHYPQGQLFFANPYTSQSDAAVAGFLQQHHHRPPQHQPNQSFVPGSAAMLSLGPSPSVVASAPDSSKISLANSRPLTPAGLLQHSAQLAHPLMSAAAAAAAFPYIQTMQSVPLKPSTAAEQKPAGGR